MSRNLQFQHLRGVEANQPALGEGELYFATDTHNLWVGTDTGNLNIASQSVVPQFAAPDPGFYAPYTGL